MANISLIATTCDHAYDVLPFKDFAPTLAQCYLLVIIGYAIAKFQLLSAADTRGVSAFVGYIGMPGIICITLADADFGDLRWELVLALFLGKCFIFVLVAGVTLVINRNIGIAGLLAVFCVHTNDLPVGNPLMSSIYKTYRPHMMKYLFLMPAMTMVIFVPVGTFMLEIHKVRQDRKNNSFTFNCRDVSKKEISSILQSLYKSLPVIISSTLGILLNLTFREKLPSTIHQPIEAIAATVPGCVLSILGFNMVRKERYLLTSSVITATVLLSVKMFITPIVTHTLTRLLTNGSESSKDLSDFAVLYGILSPATGIFLSGQEFRKPIAAMSAALIISSFLCFPSSYVVGRFTVGGTTCQLDEYIPLLKKVLLWIASLSLFCDIFVAISIFWKKKWNMVPYCYILCLVLTQLLVSCSVIIWNTFQDQQMIAFSQMVIYCVGEITDYFWVGTIAAIFAPMNCFSAVFHKRVPVISFIMFIMFAVFICVICLIPYNDDRQAYIVGSLNSTFEYYQLIIFSIFQALAVTVTAICLLLHSQKKSTPEVPLNTTTKIEQGFDNPSFSMDTEEVTVTHYKKNRSMSILSVLSLQEEADLYCEEALQDGGQSEMSSNERTNWTFRLFSLLLILLITTSLKLISNLYKLFNSNALEIIIPLEFLQSSLFVGQGFFIFLTFGIDARTISIEVTRWWRKIFHGKEEFVQSSFEKYDKSAVSLFCNQFRSYYFKLCFESLAKDRKWKVNSYKYSFWGHQLVDWMIQEGVAKDDVEAEEMGQKLAVGGIISHVTGAHNFHDAPYLYYFLRKPITHSTE
ncbi:hypothetical protein JTE90_013752 [Oedothorax gibbosus]|uniref:DEP domain-containing protein n=1 Tax=Oedothorax gibbosus TaxID=931172 RepID=A0AAV6UXY9_9ARAC|nr:hypothetical protein JTE90_013752 [Oedothorax gibbosus]